jgi:hypothetical protein
MNEMGLDIKKFCQCEVRDGKEKDARVAAEKTETLRKNK